MPDNRTKQRRDRSGALGRKIFAALLITPNQTITQLAKALEVERSAIKSMMATMEGLGLLLAEDDKGRLIAWEQVDNPVHIGSQRR